MNPLTVTWAPHKYTQIGHENFETWCHTGFNNLLFTPNGKLHQQLTKKAFLNLCHPFQPFIIGQRQIGPQLASKFNIPLIFYGENGAEYGNPIEQGSESQMRRKFFSGDPKEDIVIVKSSNLRAIDHVHSIYAKGRFTGVCQGACALLR